MPTAAIIGCAGYTGQETLDRLLGHPDVEVVALGSSLLAGERPSALDVRLNGRLPSFTTNEEALASGADVVFLCLGHEEAAAIDPPTEAVVVDLSGGHRLADPALYGSWYGFDHPRPAVIAQLPESAAHQQGIGRRGISGSGECRRRDGYGQGHRRPRAARGRDRPRRRRP